MNKEMRILKNIKVPTGNILIGKGERGLLEFLTHELAAFARENFRDLYFEYLFINMPKNYGK